MPESRHIQELVEDVAAAVMMLDPDAGEELAPLRRRLHDLQQELGPAQPEAARLAGELARIVEAMEAGTVPVDDAALGVLASGMAALQGMCVDYQRTNKEVPVAAEVMAELTALVVADGAQGAEVDAPATPSEATAVDVDVEAFELFAEEAAEHLADAEQALLGLEAAPQNTELLNRIFRAFHTVKGSAAYPDLPDVITLAHKAEDLFDDAREGKVVLGREAIDVALQTLDMLGRLIGDTQRRLNGQPIPPADFQHLLLRLAELRVATTASSETTTTGAGTETTATQTVATTRAAVEAELPTDSDIPAEPTTPGAVVAEDGVPGTVDSSATAAAAPGAAVPDTDPVTERLGDVLVEAEQANLDDLSVVARVQVQLEDLLPLLDEDEVRSRELIEQLGLIVERIILEESEEPEQAWSALVRGIGLLADVHRGRRDEEENGTADPLLLREIAVAAGSMEDAAAVAAAPTQLTPEAAAAMLGGDAPSAEDDLLVDDEEDEAGVDTEMSERTAEEEIGPTPTEPVSVDLEILDDFMSEASEHLETAESTMLALEGNPTDGELLNKIFRSFHTIKGAAGFLNMSDVTLVAHAIEDILDGCRKDQLTLNAALTDVVLESIDLLKELMSQAAAQAEAGSVRPRDVSGFLARVRAAVQGRLGKPAGTATRETEAANRDEAPSTAPAAAVPTSPSRAGSGRQQSHVRVDTDKLDSLVNVVGELVITQTQVAQNPDVCSSPSQKLGKDISQLMKISNDLQEISMSLRMVPIKATFERMARMVRDLARKCGKEIEFSMRGEDTELDKNVVEEIVDPLTHMVRNAVDHGIESTAERRAAGKPEKGKVLLQAYHKGGHVVIELRDDGKGIDRDRVLKKARDRGLVRADEELRDKDIYGLIFHPGLSTAEKISDVSGRGVGMDVVRRNVEQLRGKVEVDSEPGQGSVFTIRLPLTLAIIDGMIVGVGEQRYILPLTSIVSSLRPVPEQVSTMMNKGEMIRVQDELFPLLRLHERFGVEPRHGDPCEALVVLIESEGDRCCLLVDELLGLQQVVIKGLHEELRQDPCLSGCAILGDGRVGLILDANGLVQHAERQSHTGRDDAYQRAS